MPLPILRSEALLELAEELAKESDRNDADKEQLTDMLAAVHNQLAMAKLLGYGDQGDYKSLYVQLDEIERKTAGGQSGEGLFDKMKAAMSQLWSSITS